MTCQSRILLYSIAVADEFGVIDTILSILATAFKPIISVSTNVYEHCIYTDTCVISRETTLNAELTEVKYIHKLSDRSAGSREYPRLQDISQDMVCTLWFVACAMYRVVYTL